MTNPAAIIGTDLVLLDVDAGTDKESVIDRLAGRLADAGRVSDRDALKAAALAREAQSATGLPGGIAIPALPLGGRADAVDRIRAARTEGRLRRTRRSGGPRVPDRRTGRRRIRAHEAVVEPGPGPGPAGVRGVVAGREIRRRTGGPGRRRGQPDAKPTGAPIPAPKAAATKAKSIIAITACPTGIAHTYMAADALKLAAERAGIDLTVETQGSSGSTPVGADIIANADAVIFATDVGVKDRQRFAGKPVIASGSSVRSTSPTR